MAYIPAAVSVGVDRCAFIYVSAVKIQLLASCDDSGCTGGASVKSVTPFTSKSDDHFSHNSTQYFSLKTYDNLFIVIL